MRQSNLYPGESKYKGLFYLLPGFLIYSIFIFYPVIETIRTSFFEWNGFSNNPVFIGFTNYVTLLTDEKFFSALLNNLIFIIFYSIIPIFLGLVLASALTRKTLPGFLFFRTILFLPQVLSMVVVGVIWRWMLNPSFGPINLFLKAIGQSNLTKAWLGDFSLALPSVGSIGTWVEYGFCMILFLAGMQHINEEFYEASSLDGANSWQQLTNITIPGLRSEISVALVTTIIAALRVFDLVYVTTRGGPGNSTMVAGFLIYRSAFLQNEIGYAAALATILSLIILIISLIVRSYQAKNQETGS